MRREKESKISRYILAEMQLEKVKQEEYKRRKQYEEKKGNMHNNGRKNMVTSEEKSKGTKSNIK